jgi:hypothetical protein
LKRLGVEAIDLYQIHWPAWSGNPESASLASVEEAVGALAPYSLLTREIEVSILPFAVDHHMVERRISGVSSRDPNLQQWDGIRSYRLRNGGSMRSMS